jgi:Ca2+-binding RTX toxin-like protein
MKTAQSPRTRLGLETLEGRANPSTLLSNGDLYITGTAGNDVVTVRSETYGGTNYIRVIENGVSRLFGAAQVSGGDVFFFGLGGNDYVNNTASSLRLTAHGGDGNDILLGGSANDCLSGDNGDDILLGYGGNDVLCGGNGYDRLYGMAGNDRLDGGIDGVRDYLSGGTGADRFRREPYFILLNRDTPVDFTPGVDSYWS